VNVQITWCFSIKIKKKPRNLSKRKVAGAWPWPFMFSSQLARISHLASRAPLFFSFITWRQWSAQFTRISNGLFGKLAANGHGLCLRLTYLYYTVTSNNYSIIPGIIKRIVTFLTFNRFVFYFKRYNTVRNTR
jgi:hypothetical protein